MFKLAIKSRVLLCDLFMPILLKDLNNIEDSNCVLIEESRELR